MPFSDIPAWITPVLTGIIGAGSGILVGRRKRNADADNMIVESARKIIDEWQKLKEEKDKENINLHKELNDLKDRVSKLEFELKEEREALLKSRGRITQLEKEKEILEKKINGIA